MSRDLRWLRDISNGRRLTRTSSRTIRKCAQSSVVATQSTVARQSVTTAASSSLASESIVARSGERSMMIPRVTNVRGRQTRSRDTTAPTGGNGLGLRQQWLTSGLAEGATAPLAPARTLAVEGPIQEVDKYGRSASASYHRCSACKTE